MVNVLTIYQLTIIFYFRSPRQIKMMILCLSISNSTTPVRREDSASLTRERRRIIYGKESGPLVNTGTKYWIHTASIRPGLMWIWWINTKEWWFVQVVIFSWTIFYIIKHIYFKLGILVSNDNIDNCSKSHNSVNHICRVMPLFVLKLSSQEQVRNNFDISLQ